MAKIKITKRTVEALRVATNDYIAFDTDLSRMRRALDAERQAILLVQFLSPKELQRLGQALASITTISASCASKARQPAITMGWSSTIRTRVGSFAWRFFAAIWGAADWTATVALIAGLPCPNPCKQTKNKLDKRCSTYSLSLISVYCGADELITFCGREHAGTAIRKPIM